VNQPDHGHFGAAQDAVQVGQRVLADGRIQQVGSGQVAQAVAERHQAAERADVARGQRDHGVVGAQRGGGQVQDQVVRADGHDRAGDLVDAAQQLDVHLLPRVVTQPGRDDQQPVGTHQRGQHPGPARQRGGDRDAAHQPEPDPHPVVQAERGGQLAGQPGAGPRALARRRAGQFGEQRLGEDVEGQRGRHGIAGGAEHRGAADRAGWPGRTATPWTASVLCPATTRAV
jgi:hypothetical protein